MAQIIASIFAEGREATLQRASRAAMAGADWIELRLDRWPLDADLQTLIAAIRLPVLVAIRMPEDGGSFRGTASERRELFHRALSAGAAGIDLEHWESWTPSVGLGRLRLFLRSFHSLTGVPRDLPAIHERLFAQQGTVAKIAVTAHDLADAAPVLDLLQAVDQRTRPTVAFAMGRTAWPTRILAAAMGAPYVYASVDAGEETAPGQVPVGTCHGLYRVHSLTASTLLYGLLGNPALHSLGPVLHNRALRRLGLDGLYLPFETARPEAVLAMLPRARLRGMSVTAPWKASMAQQCHRQSDEAAAVSVVNTMVFEAHGHVVGHNTDIQGVLGALRRAGFGPVEPRSRAAAVLGTGGAARAAAFALLRLGYAVTMFGRTLEPVRPFAQHHAIELAEMSAEALQALAPAIVVNATPLGGARANGPADPDERPVEGYVPLPGTAVLDMVYQPRHTRFLRDCEASGAIAIPGAEMFLTQAAAQVELFTGTYLSEGELRA
ncbi:MAG: type I 3-dehydroquinate dehydratase, partial [Planctomycetota bacterium]